VLIRTYLIIYHLWTSTWFSGAGFTGVQLANALAYH